MKEVLLALGGICVVVVLIFSSFMRDSTSTNSNYSYGKICLDGVVYWRGYQTLAVKYKPDGTVELCK